MPMGQILLSSSYTKFILNFLHVECCKLSLNTVFFYCHVQGNQNLQFSNSLEARVIEENKFHMYVHAGAFWEIDWQEMCTISSG